MVLPTVLSIYVIPNTKDPMGGWLPSPSRDLWKILCEKRVNKIYQSEKKKKKKKKKKRLSRPKNTVPCAPRLKDPKNRCALHIKNLKEQHIMVHNDAL